MNPISENRHLVIDRNSPIPAYQQIANDIIRRIADREWRVEDKLPSEMELSQNYGVSRITLRQAMTQLEKEGIIEKFQGKGAFVKKNPRRVVQDLAFPSLDMDNPVPNPIFSQIIKEQVTVAPSSEVRHQLKIEKDAPVVEFQRIHYHEKKAIGLSYIWFPKHLVPGLCADILINQSISKTLYYTYHYHIISIDNYIESVKLDAVEASLLNSVYDAPGLKISSQYLLTADTPIEYSSTVWLSDYTRLHYRVQTREK